LTSGEERQAALAAKRSENVPIDPAGISHAAIALGHDTIAAPRQLLAATCTTELGPAAQQDDGRRSIGANGEVEGGSAHANRACRRQNLIG
jgi:hypothetical protein